MVANEGTKLMTKRKIRSISTDSGVRCHLTSLKNETFKALAKKDIEDKLFQGINLYLNNDYMIITRNYMFVALVNCYRYIILYYFRK